MIFAKMKDQTELSDFILRRMVGKGTFGKVFLVEH
jgi:hypothetical protein